jgi:RNA-directed DNA polymerase
MAQNLAALILELKPLVVDARANWAQIVELLARHRSLAEFEVARFYAAKALDADALLDSVDPRERLQATGAVHLTFGRSAAAKALRRLVKDPDSRVRSRARRAARDLGLDDVALRDTRLEVPDRKRQIGGWNWSGWSFGTLKSRLGWRVAPKKPTRGFALKERGLPVIATTKTLAKLLDVPTDQLVGPFMRPGARAGSPYVEFEIPKATGGTRRIAAPRAPLRAVQRAILDQILAKAAAHGACHGFVTGRSTVTNATPHVGAALVVKMDLQDFFPSVHYRRVLGLFQWLGYGEEVAAMLAALTTHRPILADGTVVWPGVLPQGAPTSPAISNLVCRRLDARLTGLCKKAKATYTRYADDLTFSFRAEPQRGLGRFLWWVDQVCQQEGFTENTSKRRILRPKSQQRVTGIVVNQVAHVPRDARRTFRAILANCKKQGVASQSRGRDDFEAYLQGYAAYVSMVQPDLGARLVAEVASLLDAKPAGGG